jgi:hypothetical protein
MILLTYLFLFLILLKIVGVPLPWWAVLTPVWIVAGIALFATLSLGFTIGFIVILGLLGK